MTETRFVGVLFEKLGHHGSRVEKAFNVPWREEYILAAFGEHPAQNKDDQQLFGAARYREGANRGVAGVEVNTALVLDCDCADVGEMDRICGILSAAGYAFMSYTSWSHRLKSKVHKDTGKEGPFDCFRIALPYSRELSPAEHRVLVPALFGHEIPVDPAHYKQEALGKWVTEKNGRERAAKPRGWDPVCSRPAQGYYVPSAYSQIDVYYGKPLDVEAVFNRPTTAQPTALAFRERQAPNRESIEALGRIIGELSTTRGVFTDGHDGWHRAPCPACAPSGEQRSPSFTFRANGNGVDLHCHAGCVRGDLLRALNLTATGAYRAPSDLRLALNEQLERQTPRA